MPFFPSLEIGKRALLAQQLGLDTTSNNVANVNTPGYSRRRIELVETEPVKLAAGTIGTGVRAGRIVRVQDEFFDKEIRNSIATKKYNETLIFTFQRLEAILGEGSDTGLDRYIQRFFDALNDLALEPESLQRREAVLSTATSMINAFHRPSTSFWNKLPPSMLKSALNQLKEPVLLLLWKISEPSCWSNWRNI